MFWYIGFLVCRDFMVGDVRLSGGLLGRLCELRLRVSSRCKVWSEVWCSGLLLVVER